MSGFAEALSDGACLELLGSQTLCNSITSHAVHPSGRLMAVSTPLERNIALYAKTDASLESSWELNSWLREQHVAPVTGLAFAQDGRLASSSHDRSAFVWVSVGREPGDALEDYAGAVKAVDATIERQAERSSPMTCSSKARLARTKCSFEPQLVVTQLRQACLCMSWSPDGARVALGSSDGTASICTHDAARQLWAPRALPAARLAPDAPAGQRSAVLDICWHPNSTLLAVALSTGCLCVVVGRQRGIECSKNAPSFPGPDENASGNVEEPSHRRGGDAGDKAEPSTALHRAFGEVLWSRQLPAWPTSVAWSADGRWVAAACQAPVVCFYAVGAEGGEGQEVATSSLPLRRLCFLRNGALVGGGFDGLPHAFSLDPAGTWREISLRTSRARREAAASASPTGHDGAIVSIQEVLVAGERAASKALGAFTTAGDDGRVLTWILQRS